MERREVSNDTQLYVSPLAFSVLVAFSEDLAALVLAPEYTTLVFHCCQKSQ